MQVHMCLYVIFTGPDNFVEHFYKFVLQKWLLLLCTIFLQDTLLKT